MATSTTRFITLVFVALVCGAGAAMSLPLRDEPVAQRPIYQLASLQETLRQDRSGREQETTAGGGAPGMEALQPDTQDARVDRAGAPSGEIMAPPSPALQAARAFSAAFTEVAETATPAVVQIRTERSMRTMRALEQLPDGHPTPDIPHIADGTGFLVSSDGLILTNNHVIAGADRIRVILWDKRVFDATVVGADPTTDLALVLVDEGGLPSLPLGDSEELRVGEWVLAIGNPGFREDNTLDFTVTSGIVSAKGRPLDVIQDELSTVGDPAAAYAIEDFIQTDAAINPGNSGGPLLNLDGAVVGINTAIASVNGVNQGYGFAVPSNVARRVMRDLLAYGHVRRPLLGISIQNIGPEDAQVYGLPRIAGVLVEDFAANSPAERAGVRRHDVIVGIDGEAVTRLGQFQRLVASRDPGDVVAVEIVRYGERLSFSVRLTEANLGSARVVRTRTEQVPAPELGIELVDLTPTLARERGFRKAGGPLVASVARASAADRRGVPEGVVIREINRVPVASSRDAERLLATLSSGTIASLLLEDPQGGTFIRNVRIP